MTPSTPSKLTTSVLPGYVIEALIFDSDPTRIYRARRQSDNAPVMLKSLGHDRTAREAAACLKHEFEMANRVQVPSVIKVYGLELHRNVPVVVLEDFGGDSLDNLAKQRSFTLQELLGIAVQLAHGLGEIHAANVIHKDINPSNLVYNPETRVLKIIDFGISSYLTREQAAIASPQVLEASLPYISPEQTGRMNRSIDYRTDYYSFGVTLYELLTGRPLFTVQEPIEWFHSHIAKRPLPPSDIAPAVPRMVSDIIMKLLAKMAEDRYQSAQGIKADLQRCLDQLNAKTEIDVFALAEHDVPIRFQIPQRLYGRETEVANLLASFNRVNEGNRELILVSGYSGIGKTCLIKEIYKPITERRGHFISGKFDQLHRNVPYSAVVNAMRDLVRQLLTETEARLSEWRNAIIGTLGVNAQLMVDVLRDLELIIGPQPAVAQLPPKEAEQRFHRVFHNFIQLFAQPQHPLVIFLDDLQWADSASLKIVEMLTHPDTGVSYLLLIGAFRNNEVHDGHPLMLSVAELRKSGTRIEEIQLRPLQRSDLARLLSDALVTDVASVQSLAELVEQKTEGNPFFTEEFLKFLHKEGLIRFSTDQQGWCWDIGQIQAQQMTDNVVELMTEKLQQLMPETLGVLELGACIGNRFKLGVLSVVSQCSPLKILPWLKVGMTEGVIAPIGDAYQLLELDQMAVSDLTVEFAFAHDRIQQAAYLLMDEAERQRAHLNIGRLLLCETSESDQKKHLFDITNHLNLGVGLIENPIELDQLCRLNLEAGTQAKASSAYQPAYEYMKQALKLLRSDGWQHDYVLSLEVHAQTAEVAYLSNDHGTSTQLLAESLKHSKTVIDEARLYGISISALIAQGQMREAVDLAKPIMVKLGYHYPANTKKWHVVVALLRLLAQLRKTGAENLRNLPEMSSALDLAAHDLGSRFGAAAMLVEPYLMSLMVLNSVRVQCIHGYAPIALSSWTAVGMVFAVNLKQPQRADDIGRLSLQMVDRFQAKAVEGRVVHVYNALVRHWKEPVRNSIEPLQQAYRLTLDSGDFEFAALASIVRLMHLFESGMELGQWREEVMTSAAAIRPLKQGNVIDFFSLFLQLADNLMGVAKNPAVLTGQHFDIELKGRQHSQSGDVAMLTTLRDLSLYANFMFSNFDAAAAQIAEIFSNTSSFSGFYVTARAYMIAALSLLVSANNTKGRARGHFLKQARHNEAWLKRSALHCPENFRNKYALVVAKRLHVLGRDLEANAQFDEAIRLAAEQGFVQEQALACEMCGEMHMAAGRETMAEAYILKAKNLYQRWGAKAKVDQLQEQYPQFHQTLRKAGTTNAPMGNIDVASLMKALKAIADEKIHSRMLEAIVASAVEFAGAEAGMLILRNSDGEYCIEGEVHGDGASPHVLQTIPAEKGLIPQTLLHYVLRTQSSVVVHDAQQVSQNVPGLELDIQVQQRGLRSLLCLPIQSGNEESIELIGLIYLENNLISGAFTEERFNTLEIIGIAAAGRLELSRKATFDGLTRLFNHEYFQNMLAQHIETSKRHRRDLGLLLIDIDHFKKFNDTWGHQAGDHVLRDVAQLIKSMCRSGDVVARYGGEEMAVILPETTEREALLVAERVREAIENHQVKYETQQLSVTISVGLALLDANADIKDMLIRRADEALYQSKRDGRNRVSLKK